MVSIGYITKGFYFVYIDFQVILFLQMTESTVLYEDDIVKLTNDRIEIFQYYFPLPMNKTVLYSDVK